MDNQKDTSSIIEHSYGQKLLSDTNMLINKPIYLFLNQKIEKLVTALYMVTDCMEQEESLRLKLRSIGVNLVSDINKLSVPIQGSKLSGVENAILGTREVISLVNIASTIGLISDMNKSILVREFNVLIDELNNNFKESIKPSFVLSESMFKIEKVDEVLPRGNITDNFYKGQNIKRTQNTQSNTVKESQNPEYNIKDKQQNKLDRSNKILSFIKDKKDSSGKQVQVPIKDISLLFTDCSKKTIQRELNTLVDRGLIKKTGAKRWSLYQAI